MALKTYSPKLSFPHSQAKKSKPLAAIKEEASRLRKRSTLPLSSRLVLGEGNKQAVLAIVGEAPGKTEEALGRPFVGPAGRLLDQLLDSTGINRSAAWVTNVVKVRPTKEGDPDKNRAPIAAEIKLWAPLLRTELGIIKPRVILGLGTIAGRALVASDFLLTPNHGRWFETVLGPCLITFHPSYILKRHADAELKKLTLLDFSKIHKKLVVNSTSGNDNAV